MSHPISAPTPVYLHPWKLADHSFPRPLDGPTGASFTWIPEIYGNAVWNDPILCAARCTSTDLLVYPSEYFEWLLTNRLNSLSLSAIPTAYRSAIADWQQKFRAHLATSTDPMSRIATHPGWRYPLCTMGFVADRTGRVLFTKKPTDHAWLGSGGGGIVPDDWTPQNSDHPASVSWRREIQEELGVPLSHADVRTAVFSPRHHEVVFVLTAQWDGTWDDQPWLHATDFFFEDGMALPIYPSDPFPPLTPLTQWAWNAVQHLASLYR